MLKSVIFDMDGVILDSEPINFAIEKRLFAELGITVSRKEHESYVGTNSNVMWRLIRNKHHLENSIEELTLLCRERYFEYLDALEELQPIPGVVELLDDLQEHLITTILASSADREKISIHLKMLGLGAYFAIIVSGEDVPESKPEPAIFLRALAEAGLEPGDCVVIEDSTNGVLAAKAAGLKCIGFANSNSGRQDLSAADHIIDKFLGVNFETIRRLFS